MITIIITSYKEPKATIEAIKAFLNQEIEDKMEIIVVEPFQEAINTMKKSIKSDKVKFVLDYGEGKSEALNMLFQEHGSADENDVFILSDGDVYVSEGAIAEIMKKFEDKKIGCVTGKPVPAEDKSTKYGYWAHLLFDGIDRVRKRMSKEKKFFECSGYLFAIRKNVILDFPTGTSEDSIIPYLFWKKGYLIDYADKAEVYVKNPANWDDWLNQKIRNIKAHENLNKIAPDMPRTKSFWNEIKEGALFALLYPQKLKEIFWTVELFIARFYIYAKAFQELRKGREYKDGWREIEIASTKPLD